MLQCMSTTTPVSQCSQTTTKLEKSVNTPTTMLTRLTILELVQAICCVACVDFPLIGKHQIHRYLVGGLEEFSRAIVAKY